MPRIQINSCEIGDIRLEIRGDVLTIHFMGEDPPLELAMPEGAADVLFTTLERSGYFTGLYGEYRLRSDEEE
jgi:hypothetical protein